MDVTVVIDGIRLKILPDKARYETELLDSRLPHDGGASTKFVSAYDGAIATSFYIPTGQSVGNGDLDTRPTFVERNEIALRTLFLAFRPFSKTFLDLNLEDFDVEVSGDLYTLSQKVEARSDPRVQDVISIDARRDFVPVSFVHSFEERPTVQITMEYAQDGSEWIPTAWQYQVLVPFPDGSTPKRVVDAVVVAYEMNEPIDDNEFRLEFPPGTHIADRNTGEEYTVSAAGLKTPLANWGEPDGLEKIQEEGGWTTWRVAVVVLVAIGLTVCVMIFSRRVAR